MKMRIMTIVLSYFAQIAFAGASQDLTLMNQKTDELELSQEIEDIEQFGEGAAAIETKSENDRLAREAKNLEINIKRMNRATEKANNKTKKLTAIYYDKAKLAAKVEAKARAAEAKKNKAESEASRLQAKVDSKEQVAINAIAQRKAADQRFAQLTREKKRLDKRLAVANRVIEQNRLKEKQQNMRNLKLSKRNLRLQKQVSNAESRASRF